MDRLSCPKIERRQCQASGRRAVFALIVGVVLGSRRRHYCAAAYEITAPPLDRPLALRHSMVQIANDPIYLNAPHRGYKRRGRSLGRRRGRDLFRLPRQSHHSARQRSAFERSAGQYPEDLPASAIRTRRRALRRSSRTPRPTTFRIIPMCGLPRNSSPWRSAACWCFSGFIRRFGSTANSATASNASSRPHVRADALPQGQGRYVPALERPVAMGAPAIRAQHHPPGHNRFAVALSDHGLGAAARTGDGWTGNRRAPA